MSHSWVRKPLTPLSRGSLITSAQDLGIFHCCLLAAGVAGKKPGANLILADLEEGNISPLKL